MNVSELKQMQPRGIPTIQAAQKIINRQQEYMDAVLCSDFPPATLILAGSHNEYFRFLKQKKLNPNDYRYVYSNECLRGYKPHSVKVIRIGNWWRREDIDNRLVELIEDRRQR
jgi:hypothetical protein